MVATKSALQSKWLHNLIHFKVPVAFILTYVILYSHLQNDVICYLRADGNRAAL